jgi:hypothetical protein
MKRTKSTTPRVLLQTVLASWGDNDKNRHYPLQFGGGGRLDCIPVIIAIPATSGILQSQPTESHDDATPIATNHRGAAVTACPARA